MKRLLINDLSLEKSSSYYDILIKKGKLIVPEIGVINSNIAIKDGKIAAITNDEPQAREEIDATGLYVTPGIIDPHTHIGLMSSLELELETESQAAILGGVTTVGCFFNHEGSYKDTLRSTRNLVKANSRIDFIPHLTLREDLQVEEMAYYIDNGVKAFKVYMCGIPGMIPHQDDGFIFNILKEVKKLDKKVIVCVHAENTSMVDYAVAEEERTGSLTLKEWERTHPGVAEAEAIQRTSFMSEHTNVEMYIVHVSSKDSMEVIKGLNNENLRIETTSPYLTVDTESDVGVYGKMLPPLRDTDSRDALWEGIEQGLIDTIGTDNVTMTAEEKMVKEGMGKAIPGYPAVGTHLVSVIDEGVIKRGISLEKIIPLMTMNPAKIFNVYPKKGTLIPGSDADLVLIDLNRKEKVTSERILGRSDFSLFHNKFLSGWPCGTIKAGRIVAWDGKLVDDANRGEVIF